MDWKDITNTIASFAPALGAALGGPAGGAVGAMIASSLGVEDDPMAVEKVLKHDPEASFELIKLERQLGFQVLKEELKDKQDARKSHKDHWMPWLLTVILAVMTTALVYGLMYLSIPAANTRVLDYVSGQITTAFITAVAFWLGTSRSSQDKTQFIERLERRQ